MTTPYYKIWPFDLTTAREEKLRITAGLIVFAEAVDAAGVFQPGAVVRIALSDADQDFVPFFPGSRFTNKTSDQFRIKWDAQPGVTARLLIGEPDILDLVSVPRSVLVVGLAAPTLLTAADVSIAAVTNDEVLAANTARRHAILSNPFSNPREFRIGDAGASATEGHELNPGASVRLEVTAAIRAFNPHVAAMPIAALEVSD